MTFEPITSPNLAEAAAGQIRKLIAQDVLHPGDQLPGERDLADMMGISRTSLRAGLHMLVAEGLLISRQGAGLFVAKDLGKSLADPLVALLESSADAVQDYLGFRMMLEGDCAAFVAENGTTAEKDRIAEIHKLLSDAAQANDDALTAELDKAFHMALVETTGNIVAIQVARSLSALLEHSVAQSHEVAYGQAGGRDAILEQHSAILTAIKASDPDAARQALRAHLAHFGALFRKAADAEARERTVEKRMAWDNRT